MKNQQKKELSNCCITPAEVNCADEGTCFYMCTKCEKACDVHVRGDKTFEEIKVNHFEDRLDMVEEWEKKFNLWITNYDDEVFIQDGYYFHDDLKEHIRQQRQEAYEEGYDDGIAYVQNAPEESFKLIKEQAYEEGKQDGYYDGIKYIPVHVKLAVKKAIQEFSEKIYKILASSDDANYVKTEAMLELRRNYREALEVYEGK